MSLFQTLKKGDVFIIGDEKYRKTGPSTYVSIENPILGEYTIQPITESRVVVPGKPKAAPTKAKAKKATKPTAKPVKRKAARGK